jgi:HD-like signal output (HDOD) protein
MPSPLPAISTKDHVLKLAQKLPASPQIFSRLTVILNDVNADLGKIVNLISIDTGLTARVIRLSNSVFFRGSSTVQSLDEAIGRIGFQEVHKIVGVVMTEQISKGGLSAYGFTAAQIWENSVATALAMEALAQEANEETHVAYTIGLLRQIGKHVFCRLLEKEQPGVVCPDDTDLSTWERARLNLASHEAASLILESWKLPPPVVRGMRYHYQPEVSQTDGPLGALLHLSCWVVESMGLGMKVEAPLWEPTSERLGMANVSEDTLRDCVEATQQKLDRLKKELASS